MPFGKIASHCGVELLNRYFSLNDHFDGASAYMVQATARTWGELVLRPPASLACYKPSLSKSIVGAGVNHPDGILQASTAA